MWNIKSRKVIAFLVNEILFTTFFILLVLFAREGLNGVGVVIIIMLMLNGVTFIGGVVFEKWTQSKYFGIDDLGN